MKSFLKITFILQLLLLGCGSSQREEDVTEEKAKIHYIHGTDALQNKDYTTALDHLIKSNNYKPGQTKTLNNLGMAYFFKKESAQALKVLLLSLKADPKNSDARGNLASLYYEMGEFQKAEEQYRIVLQDLVYKHQYRIHHNLALIALKRGSYDKAVAELKKSILVKDDYCPSNYKLGNLAYRRFDYEQALKYYRAATKGNCYNLAEPHLKQADTLVQLKKYTEARLKLSDIKNQFKGTKFDSLAKAKLNDLDNLEKQQYYLNNNSKTINNFYNQ